MQPLLVTNKRRRESDAEWFAYTICDNQRRDDNRNEARRNVALSSASSTSDTLSFKYSVSEFLKHDNELFVGGVSCALDFRFVHVAVSLKREVREIKDQTWEAFEISLFHPTHFRESPKLCFKNENFLVLVLAFRPVSFEGFFHRFGSQCKNMSPNHSRSVQMNVVERAQEAHSFANVSQCRSLDPKIITHRTSENYHSPYQGWVPILSFFA